jgi:hypothetical protein
MDEEPELIAKMLRFLYTGDYDDTGVGRTITLSDDPRSLDGEEEVSAAAPSDAPPSMFLPMEVNTWLYTYGDKFGIPSLKAAATAKFMVALTKDSSSPIFDHAVRLVLEVTPDDSDLRYELLHWCIDHNEAIRPSVSELMKKHMPISWKLYLEMMARLRARPIVRLPKRGM